MHLDSKTGNNSSRKLGGWGGGWTHTWKVRNM